jgi:PKD repeat protein
MGQEADDRYLHYCIARLSAYRNVWWSLANEFDFMEHKQMGDWDRFFSILQKEDPYHRLRGIHNGAKWYDHTKDWVTHASLQTSDMNGGIRFRELYHKPIVYDECKYEGNIPDGWGHLTGREMTQRFWLGTLSGCYVGHGETFKDPHDVLWWSKGGVLHGESPKRIQRLKDFMAQAPPFHELQPMGDDKGHFILGKSGQYYLLYCLGGTSQSIQLAGKTPYKVDAIDPWEMTITPVGTVQPGKFKTAAPNDDIVYRFMPYVPGEKLRPEARATASATEGVAPLTVKFDTASPHLVRWDFGDGATATNAAWSHTFEKPGLYPVTLTVTDDQGASARNQLLIAVDRNSSGPIVQAGCLRDETPALKLYGTAKRAADGGLLLPDGAQWGRAEADTVTDDLRGLRSFTILGWVKSESLQTGSGGNRIVFCLNNDHSGIDLVCHEDGRLRLSVNEWPDGVQNDSSPGKLQVGEWTFFAVSYDATAPSNNVNWYFSAPLDAPGPTAITLDSRTAYNVGPVDNDIGPLAIGNFNKTMNGVGWDRQFRGEIRNLQIFGSRVSGRGALAAKEINSYLQAKGIQTGN